MSKAASGRLLQSSGMPAPGAAARDSAAAPDTHVPDPQVARELGITLMSLWRYTHDPALDFPPPIKIRNRNFRSRHLLEAFKQRMLVSAIRQRDGGRGA